MFSKIFSKTICTLAELLRDQLSFQAQCQMFTNSAVIICYVAILAKFIWKKYFKNTQPNHGGVKII
jgi:hypothetical protein